MGEALSVTHQTVQALPDACGARWCDGRAGRLPAPWLVSLARQKAKDRGYPHELWTAHLLAAKPALMGLPWDIPEMASCTF
jgi:hypothetical protein